MSTLLIKSFIFPSSFLFPTPPHHTLPPHLHSSPSLKSRTASWMSTLNCCHRREYFFSLLGIHMIQKDSVRQTTKYVFSCHLFTNIYRIHAVNLQQINKTDRYSATVFLTRNDYCLFFAFFPIWNMRTKWEQNKIHSEIHSF